MHNAWKGSRPGHRTRSIMAAAAQMDPACYFCRKRKHASSACPTLAGWVPGKKRKYHAPIGGWRSFEAARTYAQNLGLTSRTAWDRWCATSKHLAYDVPANPEKVKAYKGKWVSWGDWLGTGNVPGSGQGKPFRSFADARTFARSLNLSSVSAWRRWCSEGERPEDIPANPHKIYAGQGWIGWVDFLGNELAEGEECAICLDPFHLPGSGRKKRAKLRGCGHRFHRGCLDDHVAARGDEASCPFCRGSLD